MFPHSTLGRKLANDPQQFSTLSGRIDAIAAMKRHAVQVKEEEWGAVKEVSAPPLNKQNSTYTLPGAEY
jgi:hypothetical protein